MLRAKIKDLEAKIEALVIAIPRELDAYEFYLELKEKYDDPASKKMFDYLAKQELQHKVNLEAILKRVEEQLEKAQEERKKERRA